MAYKYITHIDSPNYWQPHTVLLRYLMKRTIIAITIHHWGDPDDKPTFDGTVSWICRANGNTSAHEVIEAGRVACLIDHSNASWACGHAQGNAQTISLELNPRASDGDYETAAERIADIRMMHGKDFPLLPHKHWTATACPGRYDLDRLDRLARKYQADKVALAGGKVTPISKPKPKPVKPKPRVWPKPKSGLFWTVERGDTLGKIADHYAVRGGVERLARHNKIKNPNVIEVGRHISIPGPLYWTVDPGDTIAEIAAHYGMAAETVAANAGLRNMNYIYPGQVLRVVA